MTNLFDKTIEIFSPEAALRRETARWILKHQRAYEAAQPSRLRKIKTDPGSGDAVVERAGESLRLQARFLDENHDLARGVLNCLVNNVIGRGIPLDKMAEGDVLLFRTFKDPQHVALLSIYPTGGLGLIHCNSSAGRVVEQPLSDTWRRMLTHAYRFKNKQLQSLK